MLRNIRWIAPVILAMLAWPGSSSAEQVRYLFVPIGDACGNTRQAPRGSDGALGEKYGALGLIPRPYNENFKPTHLVTFHHPATGRDIIVPLTLSSGTPKMEFRNDRITYNYGNRSIEVRFLGDGSVEVIYISSFLRALRP